MTLPLKKSIALFHPQGNFSRPNNFFGKDVANLGLFKALIRYGDFKEVSLLNQIGLSRENADAELLELTSRIELNCVPTFDTVAPSRCGTLLRGQPYLSELAWMRCNAHLDNAYSLVGLIHTIAPPFIRELIGAAAVAPTYQWDALICTSPAVKHSMEIMFDSFAAHMANRFGAVRNPRPQLPLIPLAVDTEAMGHKRTDLESRAEFRKRFSIDSDDIVVLWVGRLSYFEKAFPQSMIEAVQLASKNCKSRLHFLMAGWFPGGDDDLRLYKQAADLLAPELNLIALNGNDSSLVDKCWAAADIFISLVDNIQETFGITPVEAMAAGLPVVVSDWDGYRYTVRDQVDGILIPTLASAGGDLGYLLSMLHSLEVETYQTYVGAVAQHTAVHVQKAAAAIAQLASNSQQRITMGEAGRRRALDMFSWPVVVDLYKQLFDELAQRRLTVEPSFASNAPRLNPLRGEPFRDFTHFATHVIEPSLRLRLSQGSKASNLEACLLVQLNTFYPGLRGSPEDAMKLLFALEESGPQGLLVDELLENISSQRKPYLENTLVWMAKLGLIDWLPS